MTTALGQLIGRRPRIAAWFVIGASILAPDLGLRAQNALNDRSS